MFRCLYFVSHDYLWRREYGFRIRYVLTEAPVRRRGGEGKVVFGSWPASTVIGLSCQHLVTIC